MNKMPDICFTQFYNDIIHSLTTVALVKFSQLAL